MNNLNVMYACDNNYAPYACISICSLLENNKKFDKINIYVVLDNVSEENQIKIKKQIEKQNANYIPVDAGTIIEKIIELGIPKYRGSYAANYRLFFEDFILEDTDRLIYLDCDTLIVNDLNKMVNYDLGECCVGVVQDAVVDEYRKLIGFNLEQKYFNTGVLLIDVKNWRRNGCTELILSHLKNKRANYCNPDQDILNIVLHDKAFFLGPQYNFQPMHSIIKDDKYLRVYKNSVYYCQDEISAARKEKTIIHAYRFLGAFPWHINAIHPDTYEFDKYMRISECNDYVKKKANLSLTMIIERILFRVLPNSVFFKLFRYAQLRTFIKQDKKLKKMSNN